jgi:hypothetical protein
VRYAAILIGLGPPIDARWWARFLAWLCMVAFCVFGVLTLYHRVSDRGALICLAAALVLTGVSWLVPRHAGTPVDDASTEDRWLAGMFTVIGVALIVGLFPGGPLVYALTIVLLWIALLLFVMRWLYGRRERV